MTNQLKDFAPEDQEELIKALLPFARAYQRLRYYSSAPTDDTNIQAETKGGTLYELFADQNEATGSEPEELLKVRHLGNAFESLQKLGLI